MTIEVQGHPAVLRAVARKRDVTAPQIAAACGVAESTCYQWWAGVPIPERHAERLLGLFNADDIKRIYASFPARVGSGRHPKDGGARAARVVARELRARGRDDLATALEEEMFRPSGGGHGARPSATHDRRDVGGTT